MSPKTHGKHGVGGVSAAHCQSNATFLLALSTLQLNMLASHSHGRVNPPAGLAAATPRECCNQLEALCSSPDVHGAFWILHGCSSCPCASCIVYGTCRTGGLSVCSTCGGGCDCIVPAARAITRMYVHAMFHAGFKLGYFRHCSTIQQSSAQLVLMHYTSTFVAQHSLACSSSVHPVDRVCLLYSRLRRRSTRGWPVGTGARCGWGARR